MARKDREDAKDKAKARLKNYKHEGDKFTNKSERTMKQEGFTDDQITKYRNQLNTDTMAGKQLLKSNHVQDMDRNQGIDDYNAEGVSGQGAAVGKNDKAGWTMADTKYLKQQGFTDEDIQGRMQSDMGSGDFRMGKKAKAFMTSGKGGNGNPNLDDYDNEDGKFNNSDVKRMRDQGYTEEQINDYRNQQDVNTMAGKQLLKSDHVQDMDRNQGIDDYNVEGIGGQGSAVGKHNKAGWTMADMKYLKQQGFTDEDIQKRMQSDMESGDYRMGKKARNFMNNGSGGNGGGNNGGNDGGNNGGNNGGNGIDAHKEQPDSENSGQSAEARSKWASGVRDDANAAAGADYSIDTSEVRRKIQANSQNMYDRATIQGQRIWGDRDPSKARPSFVLPDAPEGAEDPDWGGMYAMFMQQMNKYNL